MYDYLIVGSGLYGAVCAHELTQKGFSCLVVEKRNHLGGNIYTEEVEGIQVHKYGAHIFHTSNEEVWKYMNQFAKFNHYVNSPIARYHDECYNLPFNMNTFTKLWPNVFTPEEARVKIEEEKKDSFKENPSNLEEQALSLVGKTIYEKLIKGYTEKQWGKPCKELPAFIIKRLPVRYTFDNNYFNDIYQGIPIGGYTKIIEKMLAGIEVKLNYNFLEHKEQLSKMAKKIIYTGPIDEYYEYCFGPLEYRSIRFETEVLDMNNYQGNAVVNYTAEDIPFTRIIEHKHFDFGSQKKTVISKEFSSTWHTGDEPYYPINDQHNNDLYQKYKKLSLKDTKVVFGGRLGLYKYMDMDDIVESALEFVRGEII